MTQNIQILFHSLCLEDTFVCATNVSKDKISEELDRKIIAYVSTYTRSSNKATCILSVPLDTLLQTSPKENTQTNMSVVYMYDFPLSYFHVEPSQEGMCRLIVIPKKPSYEEKEDIVYSVFLKFIIVVMLILITASFASPKISGQEL